MSKLNCVSTPEQLTYNGEVFPSIVVFDSPPNYNAETWVQSHKHAIERSLQLSGAVLFRGFPVTSAEDFDAFSAAFGYPDFTYAESLSNAVRINFT
ncbi:TauD/TfdA family dioxygenase, partial [Pseudomonadales bacterium]|nr:TauD/TfdA family dioxygenase [Pseudomonadales bacterium]